MNQSVKDLLRAEKTKMLRKKKKKQVQDYSTITGVTQEKPFRHRLKTLQDAKHEVNVVERFQSLLLPDDGDEDNVLGAVPQPLFRSHVQSPSKTTHQRTRTSRQRYDDDDHDDDDVDTRYQSTCGVREEMSHLFHVSVICHSNHKNITRISLTHTKSIVM